MNKQHELDTLREALKDYDGSDPGDDVIQGIKNDIWDRINELELEVAVSDCASAILTIGNNNLTWPQAMEQAEAKIKALLSQSDEDINGLAGTCHQLDLKSDELSRVLHYVVHSKPKTPEAWEAVAKQLETLDSVRPVFRAPVVAAPKPIAWIDPERLREIMEDSIGAIAYQCWLAVHLPDYTQNRTVPLYLHPPVASSPASQFEVRVAGPDDLMRFASEIDAHRYANNVNRMYVVDRLVHPDPKDEVLCIATVHPSVESDG